MSKVIDQVDTSIENFEDWVDTTNRLANAFLYTVTVSLNANGESTSGNGYIEGYFGANVLFSNELRGGTINVSSNLEVSSNVSFTGDSINVSSNVVMTGNVLTVATKNVSLTATTVDVSANVTVDGKLDSSNATFIVTTGNTAQRPTGSTGILRYNEDAESLEFYAGSGWKFVGSYSQLGATAGDIAFSPTSNVTSTTVQAAIGEVYVSAQTALNTAVSVLNSGKLDKSGGTVTGTLTVSNTLTATLFSGSGSGLTGLNASAMSSGTLPAARLGSSLTYTVGGITSSGDITANSLFGDGSGLTSLNASAMSSGTLPAARLGSSLTYTVGGLTTSGTVTANLFSGSGSSLTGLNASQLTSGTVPAARIGSTTSYSMGSLNVNGTVTADLFSGPGSSLTGLNASQLTSGTVPAARIGSTTTYTVGALISNGGISGYSDIRFKDDVVTVENALDKVTSMVGVHFTRKSDGKRATGVIAQWQREIAPELVDEDDKGFLFVNYDGHIGYLIEAIKELKGIVEAQGERIALLESMLED